MKYQSVRVGNIGKIEQGGTPSKANTEYWGGNFPFLTGADILSIYVDKGRNYLTQKGFESGKTAIAHKGDVIIVSRTGVGRFGIAATDLAVSQDISILKLNQGIHPEYIVSYFQMLAPVFEEAAQGSTIKGITRSFIENTKIKIPEKLEDQIAIARDLQTQLAHVEAMRQAALKQKEAAKALQSAILREVFPWQAGESLPSGWRWEKITDISKNLDGKRIPVAEKSREKGDIPYYGASGVVDYVKDYLFDEELLLVSEDGANLVMRTYPIAFSISGKTWVNNHAHVLRFADRDTQKITEHYINGLDISDFVSGAAQPKLNQDNLNRIKIPVPVDKQIRANIVEKIEREFEVGRRIEKQVETQLAAIEALPAAILREAFAFEA